MFHWKRLLASYLGRWFGISTDDLLIRSLMTEVGSLAVLMALMDLDQAPDKVGYV